LPEKFLITGLAKPKAQMTEREYLVALSSYLYFGPARIKLLIDYFGSAKSAYKAEQKSLISIGLKVERVADFIRYRNEFELKSYIDRLKKLKINFLTIKDADYPHNLVDLDSAPPVLYIKGNLEPSDSNSVAIVGTRKMTFYGKEVTEKFTKELSNLGITIVSGLALGVDACAHKACLDEGGRTIAVLASGLDIITPGSNTALAKRIVEGRGALVSEYPLGHPPLRTNFASRNRIISGLSRAVLVIEGAQQSGTLLTASAAAEQGRPVFAVPGQITSPMSAAPLFLIESGAKMATNVMDILEELNMEFSVNHEMMENIMPQTKEERSLSTIITNEPVHLDEIVRISGLNVSDISARLTIMELKGLVKNLGGGIYKRA